jgi:hypothetical protein
MQCTVQFVLVIQNEDLDVKFWFSYIYKHVPLLLGPRAIYEYIHMLAVH